MGIARSTRYDPQPVESDDTALVEAISAVPGEFEASGWRRVLAALRRQGIMANHKEIRRLTREHDLQPRMQRRHVVATDSGHDGPTFRTTHATSNQRDRTSSGSSTLPASRSGVATPRWRSSSMPGPPRIVGYAIGRSIAVRLTRGALRIALDFRRPPPGRLHHGDGGSHHAAGKYGELLT